MYTFTKTDTVQLILSAFMTFIIFYGDFQDFLIENGDFGTVICIGLVYIIVTFPMRGVAESITGEWI